MVKSNDAVALVVVLLISFFALVAYLLFRLVRSARNVGGEKTSSSDSYVSDETYFTDPGPKNPPNRHGRVNVSPPRPPPGHVNVPPHTLAGGRVNIPPPTAGNVNVSPVRGGGHVNVASGPGRGANNGVGRGGAVNVPRDDIGIGRGGNVNIPPAD